jgi:hypothetical protein
MQKPITSLCHVDWLVYSDWATEQEDYRNERWARRIGQALQKMWLAGVDPRAVLTCTRQVNGVPFYPVIRDKVLPTNHWVSGYHNQVLAGYPIGVFPQIWTTGNWYWTNPNKLKKLIQASASIGTPLKVIGPDQFMYPELNRRLIQKFWRLVVIRATGIPNDT